MKKISVFIIFLYVYATAIAGNLYDMVNFDDSDTVTLHITANITDFCRDELNGFDNDRTRNIIRVTDNSPLNDIGFIYEGQEYYATLSNTVSINSKEIINNVLVGLTIKFYKELSPGENPAFDIPYGIITNISAPKNDSCETTKSGSSTLYDELAFDKNGIANKEIEVKYVCLVMDDFIYDTTEKGKIIRQITRNHPYSAMSFEYNDKFYAITLANDVQFAGNLYESGTVFIIEITFYADIIVNCEPYENIPYGIITKLKVKAPV